MKSKILITLLAIATFACIEETTPPLSENMEESQYLELGVMCGTVQFEDGCSPKIDSLIKFGLALVHHMTFNDAEYNFSKVIKMDPDCFWGHWGKALTYIHPLWPDPRQCF